uniref:Leucine zipper transcription factor-like protein 1 n=1 Tax=Cacopsylla melanoneura TaxID=428564 RepID=A0A8D8QN52_9HEMI
MEDDKPSNQVVSTDLGLNDHHQSILKSYIQFARYLRQQNLKSVELSFQDVIESRLLEATYTQGKVSQLNHGYIQQVILYSSDYWRLPTHRAKCLNCFTISNNLSL